MSVQRVSLSRYVPEGNAGKAVWAQTFSAMLDELDARAERDGIALDWGSLEIDTETDFEEMRSLSGDGKQLRHTSLNFAALGITTSSDA